MLSEPASSGNDSLVSETAAGGVRRRASRVKGRQEETAALWGERKQHPEGGHQGSLDPAEFKIPKSLVGCRSFHF